MGITWLRIIFGSVIYLFFLGTEKEECSGSLI